MVYPTKYARQYDFQGYQVSNPTRPLPGNQVNVDLDRAKQSINETIDFLKGTFRSDGKLANGSVGVEQLNPNLNLGFSLPTVWERHVDYTADSTVLYANTFWKSKGAHTSADGFDESKWDEIVDFGAQADMAAASAAAAAESRGAAEASETGASNAADTATAAAGAASGSADTAATKAGEASASAGAAASSQADVAATYSAFDKRYLGAKSTDPTLDNQGAALATGALYWNTVLGNLRVYDGATWKAYTAGGDMLASNALSEVNVATARANLGDFATAADLAAATVSAVQIRVTTRGCLTADDRGGADWDYVGTEPTHAAKKQSTDGKWWQISPANGVLMSRQLGLHDSSTAADCAAAMQAFCEAAVALKAKAKLNPGDTYYFPQGSVNLPEGIDLDMTGATLVRDVDVIVPLLQCVGADASHRVGNGRIRGGLLSYTAATTTNTITNSAAIWLKFCYDWRVDDVFITGPFYIGFRFEDCLDTTLDGFSVRGVYNRALYVCAAVYTENVHCLNGLCDGYAPGTTTRVTNHIINTNAFGTGTGRNVTFTNIVSRNGTTSPTGEGFAFSERIFAQKAVNCRAVNCPIGFNIQKANTYANQNMQLVNCEADTCDRGFIGTDSFYIIVNGCRSINHSAAGFEFTNCVGIIITGCLANGTGSTSGTCYGFSLKGTSSGVTYNGCIAYNNGVSGTAGSGTAFYAEATCSSIVGRGNYAALNGTKINFNGASGTDFPITSGSGNLFP